MTTSNRAELRRLLRATAARRALIVVSLAGVLAGTGCATTSKIPKGNETAQIQAGRDAFKNQDWSRAVLVLQALLTERPGSRYADEAIFLIARADYEEGSYADAEDRFRHVLQDYPDSPFAPESSYYLGLSLLSQSRPPQLDQTETLAALTQFRSFLTRWPDHELAPRARTHVQEIRDKLADKAFLNGKFYEKRGAHQAARFYFEDKVLGAFPDTPYAPKAMLELARSYKKTDEWVKTAHWAKKLLDEYPASEEAGKGKDLLAEAAGHGASPPPEGADADSAGVASRKR